VWSNIRRFATRGRRRVDVDQPPEHFEVAGTRGFFRPRGETTLDAGVELVTAAIQLAQRQGLRDLLLNVTGLTGFRSPNLGQRYFVIQKWAAAAGRMRVAMVLRAEMIDPGHFGVAVGENLGLVSNVFASEAEGLAWLDSFDRLPPAG
jgi:hypothetical protein